MSNFGLSENAQQIFKKLYCLQDESIEDTFRRVAKEFGRNGKDEDLAYTLLAEGVWRPNTPVFLNAGKEIGKVFSACYVVGLKDSMESIYDIANTARKIFQYGAGIGIPIGNLRETDAYIYEGNPERPPEGKSSGPITFMKLYDAVGETTKSGGRVRRAAIMCSMPVWHPDIINFISCKEEDGRLENMNISVNVTDKFMSALKDKVPFDLISPYNGEVIRTVDPEIIWDKIIEMAWKTADPGIIFIDNMNRYNTLKKTFLIETTNPCGEQPLQPFSCCNLSAVNIAKFCYKHNGKYHFNWNKLYDICYHVTGLMDNAIDRMDYPDERFEGNARAYRQIGIGPMGLADAMFWLDIKYDSPAGRYFAGEVMRKMTMACADKSTELAKERGVFHNYSIFSEDTMDIIMEHIGYSEADEATVDIMDKIKENGLRNSQFTTCQPTGTTALSCDASYGIEPCFGLVFQKNIIDGSKMMVVNPVFEERFKDEDWYDAALLNKIFSNGGSLKGIHGIPKEVRDVFVVAHDIKSRDRIDIQAEIQKYCSTSISSTVNLPESTTPEEISKLYKYAYQRNLKGVTIYRDGSKLKQPVTFKKSPELRSTGKYTRPRKLQAEVFTVETGNGKMYVTVSSANNDPIEVFLQVGKSGQVLNTFSEALGRVISIALQNNVPLEDIIKTMININSDKPVWFRFEETDSKPSQILSVPDGLAQLLQRYYLNRRQAETVKYTGITCSLCGQNTLQMVEGCKTCPCGFSEC